MVRGNRLKKRRLLILACACVMISGCTTSNENTNTQTSGSPAALSSQVSDPSIADMTNEDLDVTYNGIILNDQIPFEELTSKLHLSMEENNESITTRVAGEAKGKDYAWYQVSYPNKENTDFIFDYLYNATDKSGRIVSIKLIKVPTKRGISIGDSLEKTKEAYGKNLVSEPETETTNSLAFLVENKGISFTYDKKTEKMVDIFIDYDSNKAMDEMDIPSLED
ncbi:hypothetical protein ACFPVX_15630 [Cohnella faecalis]|uniref:DUF5067 domain-containing protein n=1 Tax=Cohnella faecalis TaxID=2315694 RepID=A0A398CGL0_9BACL|nr:hypothetical protein [Cohnella faecalis]RIE01595.1 hypothetical protein D3H35_24945 [Cohnella faecalis]